MSFFKDLEEKLKNPHLTKEQKVQLIQQAGENYSKQIDQELNNYLLKQRAGTALQISSAAIPLGGVAGSFGAKLGGQLLTKTLGRKLSQDIGSSAISSAASGAIFGAGRGLTENKNPLRTAAQDATTGFALGAGLGSAISKGLKKIQGKNLQQYGDIDTLNKESRKNFNVESRKYYQDYIQKAPINKDGTINFSKAGIQELLRWNPQKAKNLSKLKQDIKKAQKIQIEPNIKPEKKPNVRHYEIYRGKLGDHLIEVNKNGTRRYYTTKDTPNGSDHTTSTGPTESANNIINDSTNFFNPLQNKLTSFLEKNNPALELNSKITNGIEAIGNQLNNQDNYFLKGSVSENVYNPDIKPFTPNDIENMSAEEFSRYESAIMKQIKDGTFNSIPQQSSKSYWGYRNPLTGDKTIYTQEGIGQLSTDRFTELEAEINAQMKSIGLPTDQELQTTSNNGGGTIYIAPYTRADGTKVQGYYRAR